MNPHCIYLAIGFTILYILLAGIMQAAWMNLVNAVMLIVGSFVAVFYTGHWLEARGGWESVANFYIANGKPLHTSIVNFSPDIIFTIILPCLILLVFMCSASQAQYQPMLLAKSESDIRRGVFFASFVNSMVTYPWVILGLVAMATVVVIPQGATPDVVAGAVVKCVPTLALAFNQPWLVGILMIALLAATLSTSAQLILASSHMIVHDILKKAVNPGMSEKTFLILTRVMIFVCAILVIIPTLKLNRPVIEIFYWTFSFAIPVFGVYLIGMLWKVNRVAAWTTMVAGYAANFLWTFAPDLIWLPERIRSNVYATSLATIIFGVVMHLILRGEPGFLRQVKAAEE